MLQKRIDGSAIIHCARSSLDRSVERLRVFGPSINVETCDENALIRYVGMLACEVCLDLTIQVMCGEEFHNEKIKGRGRRKRYTVIHLPMDSKNWNLAMQITSVWGSDARLVVAIWLMTLEFPALAELIICDRVNGASRATIRCLCIDNDNNGISTSSCRGLSV